MSVTTDDINEAFIKLNKYTDNNFSSEHEETKEILSLSEAENENINLNVRILMETMKNAIESMKELKTSSNK